MIKVGDKAPEFKAKVVGYKSPEVTLKELRGKRVVLTFFPKSGTSG